MKHLDAYPLICCSACKEDVWRVTDYGIQVEPQYDVPMGYWRSEDFQREFMIRARELIQEFATRTNRMAFEPNFVHGFLMFMFEGRKREMRYGPNPFHRVNFGGFEDPTVMTGTHCYLCKRQLTIRELQDAVQITIPKIRERPIYDYQPFEKYKPMEHEMGVACLRCVDEKGVIWPFDIQESEELPNGRIRPPMRHRTHKVFELEPVELVVEYEPLFGGNNE